MRVVIWIALILATPLTALAQLPPPTPTTTPAAPPPATQTATQTEKSKPIKLLPAPKSTRSFGVALVFDARNNRGPCAIDQAEFDAFKANPKGLENLVAKHCQMRPFEDGNGYTLIILNPRFRADYSVSIVAETDLGSGIVEPRGLANVTPLNLSLLGTPVPHGGRMPSTITIAAMTPAGVLESLIDPSKLSEPLVTLRDQARDLNDAYDAVRREKLLFDAEVGRITAVSDSVCISLSGAPTIPDLRRCLAETRDRINKNNGLTPIHHTKGGCQSPAPGWTADEFDCVVSAVDRHIGSLGLIRGRLIEYNFALVADRLDTEAATLMTRLHTFEKNLDVVVGTLNDVNSIISIIGSPNLTTAALEATRRAAIRKQLKDKYGTAIDDKELNDLASKAAAVLTGSNLAGRIKTVIGDLLDFAGLNDNDAATSARVGTTQKRIVSFLPTEVDTLRSDLVSSTQRIVSAVDELNKAFAAMLADIDNVYLTFADPAPTVRLIDTSAKAGTNRIVHCKLISDERFHPYQFTAATPAIPASVPGTGVLLTVAPNPNLTVSQANLPKNLERFFTIELHKLWRANIVGGFVFSALRQETFGVGTVTRDGVDVLVPIVTNDQRPAVHYLVAFNYYLVPQDSFPGARTGARRWIPGALFGIGIENTKQFFIGVDFEPTMGIDFAVGWHYGDRTALQKGYVVDETVLPAGTTAAPVRTVMKSGVFVMFGFDINIFRRFLGTVAPAPQ